MGISNPKYFGSYLQGDLTEEDCHKLSHILESFQDNQPIQGIEDALFSLSDDQVEWVISEGTSLPVGQRPLGELRPYQTVGAAFLYYARKAILGDSVGLGKTAQVSGLINLISRFEQSPRVLFLSESKPAQDLRKELVRFTGEYFHYSPGTTEALSEFVEGIGQNYPNAVLTHSAIRNPVFQSWVLAQEEFPYDLLVVDESSVLGNSSSEIYKAAKKLFGKARRFVMLNATPFETSLDTFYHQLNLLDPTFLPTKESFDRTFKLMRYNGFYNIFTGKYRNPETFREMVSFRYLPRTRRSLGATLENCSAEVLHAPLSKEQKKLLRSTSLHKMVYDCPWEVDPTHPRTCSKIDTTLEALGILFSKGVSQVLIYSHYKESQYALKDALDQSGYSSGILNGDSPDSEVQSTIDSFKSGDLPILITNIQKSLNFGNVNHCILYSYNPNPGKMVQLEGRITRDFNIKDKHLYVILTEGKEYNTFFSTIKDRAIASSQFAGSDFSLVLSLLLPSGLLSSEEVSPPPLRGYRL